jgi:hypothetical protein
VKYFLSLSGELVSGQIQIQVSFPPKIISLQKSAIKTGKGLVAEIVCTAIGEPMPKITWYKGDEVSSHNIGIYKLSFNWSFFYAMY